MCLAVAGPVNNNSARITNLTWEIDGSALKSAFSCEYVRIMNDFVGIGYGLLALKSNEVELIYGGEKGQNGEIDPIGVKSVIGAGTGLGECFLTYSGTQYEVFPAEGGHTDFAPRNECEYEIMEFIKKQEKSLSRVWSRVSQSY